MVGCGVWIHGGVWDVYGMLYVLLCCFSSFTYLEYTLHHHTNLHHTHAPTYTRIPPPFHPHRELQAAVCTLLHTIIIDIMLHGVHNNTPMQTTQEQAQERMACLAQHLRVIVMRLVEHVEYMDGSDGGGCGSVQAVGGGVQSGDRGVQSSNVQHAMAAIVTELIRKVCWGCICGGVCAGIYVGKQVVCTCGCICECICGCMCTYDHITNTHAATCYMHHQSARNHTTQFTQAPPKHPDLRLAVQLLPMLPPHVSCLENARVAHGQLRQPLTPLEELVLLARDAAAINANSRARCGGLSFGGGAGVGW